MNIKHAVCLAVAACAGVLTVHCEEADAPETDNKAKVQFAYDAGVEVVSSYLWRGIHLAGLSVQPTALFGYDGEITSFRGGLWASVGASDWQFKESRTLLDESAPELGNDVYEGTYLVPELDVLVSFTFWGMVVGLNHQYYFKDQNTGTYSPYFCWEKAKRILEKEGTSVTEVQLGVDFGYWFENVPIYLNWYTVVAGWDPWFNKYGECTGHANSTYIELGFSKTFDPYNLTLDVNIGFSPWSSPALYYNQGFAVQCISAKLDKAWDFEHCTLDLFATGMISPLNKKDPITKDNAIVITAGQEKLYQRINGQIGLGIWL